MRTWEKGDTCDFCGGGGLNFVTGVCAITNQRFCAKHRNHTHTHKEFEMWLLLSRTRVSPLRNEPR